jgi:phage FluMu protein Com
MPAHLYEKHIGCPPRKTTSNVSEDSFERARSISFISTLEKVRCDWCTKLFVENKFGEHRAICQKRPNYIKTCYCEFCGLVLKRQFFKPHLRRCVARKKLNNHFGEPHFVQGGLPSLGKKKP